MHHQVQDQIWHVHARKGPEIMDMWLQEMCLWLVFSPKGAQLLVREEGQDSSFCQKECQQHLQYYEKTGSKNADRTPNRGQQVSVITQ